MRYLVPERVRPALEPLVFLVRGQLHAAGLVTGPAVILILLASAASRSAEIATSAALVIVFVLVTAPLSGHAIAQAARKRSTGAGDDADP